MRQTPNREKETPMSEEENKKNLFDRAIDALTDRDEKEAAAKEAAERAASLRATVEKAAEATAPKKGVVTVRSLRIRADHNTSSEVVAGLVEGNEVTILSTWSDGKNTWAKLDNADP